MVKNGLNKMGNKKVVSPIFKVANVSCIPLKKLFGAHAPVSD
jgi:hypothetical protein